MSAAVWFSFYRTQASTPPIRHLSGRMQATDGASLFTAQHLSKSQLKSLWQSVRFCIGQPFSPAEGAPHPKNPTKTMRAFFVIIFSTALLGLAGCNTSFHTIDKQPMVRVRAQPVYPYALKYNGVSGSALVEFIVDTNGMVREAQVVRATHPAFGAASVEAIRRWQFSPGIKDGRTVYTRMQQEFYFDIQEETPSTSPADNAKPQ